MDQTNDNETRNELAKANPEGPGEGQDLSVFDMRTVAASNFPADSEAAFYLGSLAEAGCESGIDELEGGEIDVVYWYAHEISMIDDYGEQTTAIRCVLIDKDLVPYQFVSQGLAQDVFRLARMYGTEPFDPPRRFKVLRKKTKRGHTFRLMPAVPPALLRPAKGNRNRQRRPQEGRREGSDNE